MSIGLAVDGTALDARSAHRDRKTVAPVITAGIAIDSWCMAKFAEPHDQRFVQ